MRLFWALAFGFVAISNQAQIAQVQHAPSINGKIDGSVQQMTAEGVTLNGGATITGDLSVPGTPTIQMNGTPAYSGTLEGSGASSPSNYTIMLNSGASLRHVIRRTSAISLPTVGTVATPSGTASVTVNNAGQTIAWTSLKNLTLNSNAGTYTVPAGSYGNFSAGSGTGFKLGVAGATQAAVYNFQNLTLNGNSTLQMLGPVVINLANGFSANAPIGASSNPAWLTLNIKSGGFTLNSGCNFYGYVVAPSGTVIINGGTQLVGGVASAYLTVNGNGLLKLQAPQAANLLPSVSLTSPASGSSYPAPASFTLTATASDPDGAVTKVEFFQGTTKIGEDTSAPYSFTVSALTAGSYSYFARVTDNGGATSDSTAISVTVSSPNQPPAISLTAPTDGATFTAPATVTVNATAADPDGTIAHVDFYQGAILIGQSVTAPYHVTTSTLSAGAYIFSAKAYDNAGAITTSGTVTITVVNPNQSPTISITAPSDGTSYDDPASFSMTATASDSDGSVSKVELFRNGILVGEDLAAPFVFSIRALQPGIYDFVVRATDNQNSSSDSAPVRIAVVHINDAPTAVAQSLTTPEEVPLAVTISGSDPDGDVLTYSIVTQPTHGVLANGATPSTFIYTPVLDFNGSDSFTFKTSDGALESAPATVQINVTPVNDAPVTYPASVVLNENSSASFVLAATDVDSSALIFSILSGPSHGTYAGSLPNVIYTPAADYSGPDAMVYRAFDGESFSAPAVVSLTVNHVNRPPSVILTAPIGGSLYVEPANFNLLATAADSDGTVTKVEFFQDSTKLGEATTAPYQLPVTSLATGSYSFTARATDNSGATSESAAVSLTVAVNNPPTVSLTAPSDGFAFTAPATISLGAIAADTDGTIARVEFYQGSTLIGQSAIAPYNFTTGSFPAGTYGFYARAYDNLGASATTGVAVVTISNPNQPPSVSITSPLSGMILVGPTTITITASANDADGTVAKVEFFNGSAKLGESAVAPYSFSWSDVQVGDYLLIARATDNTGTLTDSAPISVQVTKPNVAPTVSLTAPIDHAVYASSATIVLNAVAIDIDGTIARVEFFDGSTKLGETAAAPFTYSWTSEISGTHVLMARATDNSGATTDSPEVEISINVRPVAYPQALSVGKGAATSITLGGSDLETPAESLVFTVLTQPSHGTLTGAAPLLTYTPAVGYEGADSFDFTINDGTDDALPATIAIAVASPNAAPVVNAGEDKEVSYVPIGGTPPKGRIIVNNDEWTLTDQGFASSPYAAAFTRNVADFLTGGKPGAKFLAYTNIIPGSVDFIYTGTNLAAAMLQAGHAWVTSSTIPMTLANLKQYDAVFIGASVVDNQVLIDYVESGGSVYLSAGTHWCGCDAEGEAALWNTFLEHFGLHYNSPYNGVAGTLPVFSDHPLFYGIKTLYFSNGNSVTQLNPDDPYTAIPFIYNRQGLFGIYGNDSDQLFLHGTVTDDGRPNPPGALTYQWTQIEGPVPATLDAPNSLTTRVRFSAVGVYVFRLSASDSAAASFDDVTVTVNTPPQVFAGPDQSIASLSQSAALAGTVVDDGIPHAPTILWKSIQGPGTVTFGSPNAVNTTATFSAAGRYVLELSADDGLEVRSDYVEISAALIYPFDGPSGLAAWWPGNGTSVDVIGGHNGVLKDGVSYSVGQVSLAFGLDGVDDHIEVPAHPDLNLGASAAGLTIELWAKPGRNQDVPLVLWGTTTADGVSFRQWNGGTGLYAFLTDTAGNAHQIAVQNMFSPNVWTHVAVTYDKVSGLTRLYRNGIIIAEQNLGVFTPQTTYSLEFGSLMRENRFYQGTLDEITFYNRPLSPAEIGAIYQAGSTGKVPPDNNQPPIISAGSDIVLRDTTAVASLNGTVTDDGRPANGSLSIIWSKADGPGEVLFGSPSAPSTTATFGTPGIYLLRLDADDGLNQGIGGLVRVTVGVGTGVKPVAGIAAWWPGDGNPREVIHGNHDVEFFQGMTYITGKVSEAFSLDGVNDYSRVAAHSDLDLGSSAAGLTIELWAKPSRNQDVPLVLWGTTTADGVSFRQWNGGTGLYAFLTDLAGNGHTIAVENMFSPNVWTHVAVTYDRVSGLTRLYRNGIIVAEQNLGVFTPKTTDPLEFGSLVREGRFYQGALDEITFYNRPLSAVEINAIYLAGAAGKTLPDDNLSPIVSAGPDIVLANIVAMANLNGSVTDDNKPFGPPTTLWTVEDGPGTVNFGNASLVNTTATFSAPGTYLLKLTASDGYVAPVSDLTEVRVGISAVGPASGIAAWWPGNGNSHEIIHGGHDVELFQGMTYVTGKVSEAFSLDGVNDYGRVAANADLDLGASAAGLTIELWAKPGRNQDMPLVQWATTTTEGMSLRQWNGGVGLYAFMKDIAGTSHQISAEGMFSANTWTHVGVTYDKLSGLARLYRNGAIVAEQNLGIFTPQTSYPLQFGSLLRENRFYQGAIDEIAFYGRPLSAAEINGIYLAGASGKAPPDDNRPPVVSAGPDVVLNNAAAIADLRGSVVEDNKPFGLPSILWTMVDGPGIVSFADASSASTTATFSAPGNYLLQLTASDRYLSPVSDQTEVRVGVSTAESPPDIVAWWPGNGNPREVIHGNHDVELFQGMTYTAGKVSQAFSMDGANDYGRVAAHPDLDLGTSAAGLTIELWAKPGRNQDMPLVQWATTTTEGMSLRQWNGGVGLYAFMKDTAGTAHQISAESMFTANIWTHVAVTYDKVSGLARLYRNGIVVAQQNLGVFTLQTSYPLQFGSLLRENRFYQGALDEITFYKRALTGAELQAIYNAGAAGKGPSNTAPVVNAGPDVSATLGIPLSLNGLGSDDGLPNPPGTITYQWNKTSGPGTVTFSSETTPSTSASFSTAGSYTLRLSASDSILSGSDELTVTVVQPPTVVLTAPADNAVTTGNTPVTLSATATTAAAPIAKIEFFDGATKLGEDLTAPYNLLVSPGFAVGTHTLTAKATASDGGSAVSSVSRLLVLSSPPPPPVLNLSAPISGREVTAPVDVVGTASGQYLKSYVIQVRYKSANNNAPWKTVATGTNAVTNDILGQLDPTLLPNGLYEIRLSATDYLDRTFDQLPPFNWVSIIGGMKIGANTSTSVDLTVPSSGLPLSVVRHYDSTDSRVGDFGVGTTLANREYSVQVSQRLGADWYAYTVSGFQGLPQYIIDPAPPLDATGVEPEPRVVSITLPDNTTFRFSARLTPNKLYTEIAGGQIVFDAMPGTVGQLEAVDESTFEVNNDVLADSSFGFTDLLGIDDGEPLNPKAYRLTTLDGTKYIVSTTQGVLKVTDRNGNSTTYSPNHIAQSNGSAIDLIRDATGRITEVKDPSGRSVNYAYDPAGRLLTVTDREGRVTTYGYFEGTSLLTSIQEPGAILPEYDAYDAVGRLTSKVDGSLANGGIITERDLAHRIEKHRDALNRVTIAEYDEYGNVVRRTDALGNVTKYAFTDSRFRDKPTLVTDAAGNLTRYHFNAQGLADTGTDANGHATSYTYNANGQLLSETDALGHATVQTYDAKGNLLTRTDRAGNITTFTNDATGNVLTEHSPLGNEIRYTYNTLGLPLTESEYAPDGTLGRKRSHTFDANGKPASDTIYRTDAQGAEVPVTTSYEYNLNGQPTKTTYPDGTFSTKAYNSRGLLASDTDRSGKVASYTYDAAGRLTRTTFADDSYEEKIYDAVGRVTSERNVLGQIATNTYDDDDHLLSIVFPDIGTQSHTYDSVGRMLTDTDEGGRVTTTAYDPVGNVTKIGYPDGTSTDLVYDEVDALKSASARVFFAPSDTDVAYDPIPAGADVSNPGAIAKYPASTFLASSMNSAPAAYSGIKLPFGYRVEPARFTLRKLSGSHSTFGKLRARVAQAAPTPPPTPEPHLYKYTYDANGRVTSITNPDGSPSSIEYDAIGRPIKTTNELGQVWTYEYDPSSNDPARRTAVKGPLGYVESYLYGPGGDIEGAFDPLGNITERHYNAQNQCTDIKYSNSRGALFSSETFDNFDAEGNARHITDREGFETTIDDQRTPNQKSGSRVLTRKVGSVDYVTTETYDAAGNLLKVVDPRGAVTGYKYDFFNRRTLTTLPDGRMIQTVYGPRNRVEKVHEIASDGTDIHTTEYQYDNNDKVTKTIRSHKFAGDSITVDSEYVADGRVKTISAPYLADETPRNTSLAYNDVTRVVTITDPLGRLTVRKQDRLGRLTDDTDTAGTTTHRDYDDLNRLTAITVTGQPDPDTGQAVAAKTTMTYDAMGNVLTRTEAADTPDARTTSFSYVYQGNGTLVTTTFADGSTSKSLQDTRGLVTSTTTPRGNTTTSKYDALGRPTEIVGPLDQKTIYTYPALGETQVATDTLGRVITRKFDLSQRLVEEKLPGAFGQRSYSYDSFSKLKTTHNTRGYATTMEYDFMGRPAKVTRPDASTIATTYTALGQPRRITDARGIVTQYDYDPVLHHLTSVTAAEGNVKARTTAYGYDAADRLNQVTAPNGQVTDSVFDALGRLTKRTATLDADGTKYAESFTYYQTGELKVHRDIRGDTSHVYDAIGHLKTLTDPLNQVTKTEYDSEGNLTQATDALDRVTKYTYDDLGRLATTTLPQGATETNVYDAYHLTQTTLAPTVGGGVPIVTDYGYDDLDHVTTTTRHLTPDNVVESRVYDGEGLLTQATDAAGYATSYDYNSLNQFALITHPDTSTESFTYDGQGNRLTHERLPIADNHTYTYTPHGEIATITDALGHATGYTYDDAGNQTTATDALGRVTTNEYDYANRLRKVTLPGNRVSTFDYDTVGNRVAVTDPANRTRRFEYDSLGRLKRALTPLYDAMSANAANHSDPSGSMVDIAGQKFAASQLTYDPVGNLATLTDPNNHTTRFKYDDGNRLTHTYLPANPTTAYETNTYDYAGRRATRADADGATTLYGYDSLNRLKSVLPPSARIGTAVTYDYDPRGLRQSMTDGLGTTAYTYDNRGRLHTEQTPYAGSLTYTHDELGRLINQHSSNVGGTNTTYRYDDASRLTDVTDALRSETTTYGYNDADQLTRVAQPNGTVTTQTYDPAGRPDTTTTARGATSLFAQQYTYTPADQVDTVTTTISRPSPFLPAQNAATYTYDSSDRLLRETYAGDTINGQTDYTLDPAGNRTARSSTIAGVNAQSFLYDANNALASLFTYDLRGNPTAGPLFPGSFNDTYDFLDHHAERTGTVDYLYDGDGRRVGQRAFDSVSGRWTTHLRLISSLNPTGYDQDVEEFTDGVMTSSYTIGRSRLAGQRFVDEATTALGLTIALGADGKVYAWGNGQSTPTAVPGLANIIAVGAGASHYVALGADGKVYSWGTSNGSGQLGRGGDINTPTAIAGLDDVAAISTQLDHTLALTTDGVVYAWGDNSSGQLGDGTTTNRNAPIAVATGAVSIAAGQVHSYALMLDGEAEAWGDNTYGQLGQAGALPVLTPTTIPGLTDVSELAAGAFHALALKADGTLVTWGDNTFGQLGDPAALPSRGTPTPIAGVSGLTAIAAGARHSLALQSDGTLLAWGENRSGQLGTAYPTNLYTPTAVPGLSNLTRLAAGARSSYVTNAAGATYVMGANRNGQLGTGNVVDVSTPQLLPSGTNSAFAAIASGGESSTSRTTHAVSLRDQFFAPDIHDHTRLLTDVTGTPTQTYSYDAFGNILNATDRSGYSLPTTRYPLLPSINPYLYRGERLETETGRYHLRARDYDAGLGRLATLDTYTGDAESPMSLNRYAYTEANPVGNSDPTGHFSLSVWELLGQMDEVNRQWDDIASVGRQEEFDPEQAYNNFRNAIAGIPSGPLTVTKKERSIWMNASRQGGLIGSLADDAAGAYSQENGVRGYAAGSDVFFHTNANPRHRLSMIERTVEQAWASAYNLRHTINTGLPITSPDPKAWQTRWPAHLYHDAMLQAQLRSQMIEGPVEARFTLSLDRKLYNHARVALTASAVKNLSAAQSGGLLDWQSPAQSGTQGMDATFLVSVKSTGFAGLSQSEMFLEELRTHDAYWNTVKKSDMYVNGYGKAFKNAARGLRSMDQYDDSAYGLFVREYFATFADGIGDSLAPRGIENTYKSGEAHFEAGFTAFNEGRYLDGSLHLGGGTLSAVGLGLSLSPIGALEGGLTRALEGSVGAMMESAAVSEIRALANAADKAAAQRAYVLGNIAENRAAIQTIAGGLAKMESRVAVAAESEMVTLYHSTSTEGAAAIRAGGIDLAKSRSLLDFGKGFYTTTDLAQAQAWAARINGEILTFRGPASAFGDLRGLTFPEAGTAWKNFVLANRTGTPLHSFDFVSGPLLGNPRIFLRGGVARSFGQQTSFHSEAAARLLDSFLVH